jgi:Domain of unknown function (DUF4258)
MYSQRFNKVIHLTEHAKNRMIERDISMELLSDLIETGQLNYKDDKHAWIAKHFQHRTDNLICAAIVIDQAVIVKTVMYHFNFENTL